MIFIPTDVETLSRSLFRWEITEYVSEFFVIVGCAGELVANFFTRLSEDARKHIGNGSTVVLILALSVGLTSLIKTNELSGGVIGSLGDKAKRAGITASRALTDANDAASDAADAKAKSGDADLLSSNALIVARGAKSEANASKKEATTAENELAGALQRTARLEEQLSWRTITPKQKTAIRAALLRNNFLPLRGWEIQFSIPMGCVECGEYADALKDALDGLGGTISSPVVVGYYRVPQGVAIQINPMYAMGQLPSLLVNDFQTNGVNIQAIFDDKLAEHTMMIAIGVKAHKQ